MKVTPLTLSGALVIQLDLYGDARGFFVERFNEQEFQRLGLPTVFKQDNHSRSAPGVIRGLHYQYDPPQGKLVGVIHGQILDVLVDLRRNSLTYGQYATVELTDVNGQLVWIPPGFAHGFAVLGTDSADVLYKVDQPYNPKGEGGIHWADPKIAIQWPIAQPIVSARDNLLPSFTTYHQNGVF